MELKNCSIPKGIELTTLIKSMRKRHMKEPLECT